MDKIIDSGRLAVLKGALTDAAKNTVAAEYVSWFADTIEANRKDGLFVSDYLPIIEANKGKPRVFASVVMRTQGRRPEALREALLSLYAQSCRDFEVLLIGHKLNEEQHKLVELILSEQDEEFRRRIRFLPLDHGTRTTPLNFGFAHALGEYIMILDDDDIVMEEWMEEYRRAAEKKPGCLLHLSSLSQDWCVIDTPYGDQGLRAKTAPKPLHVYKYNALEQLYSNNCPTLGLGFPAYAFQEWGIRFDETLTTTEDWDCLMRTALLCGVSEGEGALAVYRMWVNAESSATLHDTGEWQKNYDFIQQKFAEMPIALPAGYAPYIRELIALRKQETPAIQAERKAYIAKLEHDMAEITDYVRQLENDISGQQAYIAHLENDAGSAVPIIARDFKRVYLALRRRAGRLLRKTGLRK